MARTVFTALAVAALTATSAGASDLDSGHVPLEFVVGAAAPTTTETLHRPSTRSAGAGQIASGIRLAELDSGYVPLSFAAAGNGAVTTESLHRPSFSRTPSGIRLGELDVSYVSPAFVKAAAGLDAHEAHLQIDRIPGIIAELATAEPFTSFYEARGHTPLWIDESGLTEAGRAVVDKLSRALEDGLDPRRYATPAQSLGYSGPVTVRELAAAELKLTQAAVAYAQDAQAGLVEPSSLGPNVTANPQRPARAAILDGLARAQDAVAYLDGYHPQHPAFQALRDELAELLKAEPRPQPRRVSDGPLIRPGGSDARVPALRERLGLNRDDDSTHYDPDLVAAVEAYQEQAGLVVDGIVGPSTLRALNSARDVTVADVLVNMERWRWLPPDMGGAHYVWVNVPEYRLRVVSDDRTAFETRVIVGKRDRQTPIFSDQIKYLEVNPYWNVPSSIAARDLVPQLRQDPMSLYRRGFQVFYTGGSGRVEIDPRAVDWSQWVGKGMPFHFRQAPSEVNALGRVKFMFPNQHAVYLHDTPQRGLFNRSERMFSSGCVRVEDPIAFADAMLALEPDVDGARVQSLIGRGDTGAINLARRVPVHLTYFTVWVDEAGAVQLRGDIYGHDERLKEELGLSGAEVSMLTD